MTVMTSWDLFEDLRATQGELVRMVSRARGWQPSQRYEADTSAAFWAPTVDISERKDAYLVTADLPGVAAGNVEITFEAAAQDGVLHIVGPKATEVQAKRIQVRAGQGSAALTPGAEASNGN